MSGRKKQQRARKRKERDQASEAAAAAAGGATAEGDDGAQRVDEKELADAKAWLEGLPEDDVLRKGLLEDAALEQLRREYVSQKPFPCCFIRDFCDDEFLRRVKQELYEEEFYLKANDLYHFLQTDDLRKCKAPLVKKLRDVLYSDKVRAALRKITGIELSPLNEAVDMSGNMYQQTHHLLCHDDELDQRRIAYILYLVPEDWAREDGGCLDLFDVDANLQPRAVAHTVVPQWNSFVFFEVSPVSYHQVSEVLSKKTRMSISGWLHGAPIQRPPKFVEPPLPFARLREPAGAELMNEWVGREYRKAPIMRRVAQHFAEQSSIELKDFLRKDKYEQLMAELASRGEAAWTLLGPVNKRHYSQLSVGAEEKDPAVAAPVTLALRDFLCSSAFASYISDLASVSVKGVISEVRRFAPGDYTLAHEDDRDATRPGLDVVLCCYTPKTKIVRDGGGDVHYIDPGAAEELLAVPVASNTLSIVYRAEPGTMRFVKYVNHKSKGSRFDFNLVFEVDGGSGEEEDEDDDEDDDDEEEEEEDDEDDEEEEDDEEDEEEEEEEEEEDEASAPSGGGKGAKGKGKTAKAEPEPKVKAKAKPAPKKKM